MSQILDLFGDPVPLGRGRRGRPTHIPTGENRNKVNMLLALGWSNERIAAALRITQPTLRRHYFSELKFRDVARDRLDAALATRLWAQVDAGNVGAMKEFQKLIERNDMMRYGQERPPEADTRQPKPLGKKEQAELDAHTPFTGSTLGDLMAQRQGQSDPSLN